MIYNFYMPSISYMGLNAINKIEDEIKLRNLKKALIVTDKVLVDIELIEKLTDILDEIEIEYIVFDETKPNPTITNVNDGLKVLKENSCDFVISFGGGSPHDAAKGIALVATNGGDIKDYEGVDRSKNPQLPLIAINTTAGTASEMTRFCIITDEERHIKMAIVDKNVTPTVAINDPGLMMDMPKKLTAATGMDALTHAIEAYVSIIATPVTDACAEKAIELITNNLREAVFNRESIEARENMAYAEYLAGMAFNSASLGYVHAMAHQLGGFYDLPHGVCNAILLPHVVRYNGVVSKEKLKKVAVLMGVDPDIVSEDNAADLTIDEILQLSKDVGIPSGIKELGAKEGDFTTLAINALKDACGFTNPKQATLEEIIGIYKNAM